FRPRNGADLHAGDPRYRGLFLRQCADHGLGRDFPLWPGHQIGRDRDRAHGRGWRDLGRRRHGERDRRDRARRETPASPARPRAVHAPAGLATTMSKTPAESESDTNLSPQRRAWADRNLDPEARTPLAEDEKYFLRQSVSTPCLNAVVKAEGIWIEDTAGRRYMDFHGNNVHHI